MLAESGSVTEQAHQEDSPVDRPELSVIGNLNWDLVLNGVDQWPVWGTEVFVARRDLIPGGIAHSAVAARRQGTHTSIIGCIGWDEDGTRLLNILGAQGVITAAALRVDSPTGLSVGIIRSDGERAYLTYQGALAEASMSDLWNAQTPDQITSRYVLFSGLPLIRSASLTAGLAVLQEVRRQGHFSAMDVGWDPAGWPEDRVVYVRSMFGDCHYVIMNAVEVGALLQEGPERWADGHGCNVIVRHGEQGVHVYEPGRRYIVPGYRVVALDTGGAGDVWNGSFFSGLCRGFGLEDAARWANGAAALYVSREPGMQRYPTREEVGAFMLQADKQDGGR